MDWDLLARWIRRPRSVDTSVRIRTSTDIELKSLPSSHLWLYQEVTRRNTTNAIQKDFRHLEEIYNQKGRKSLPSGGNFNCSVICSSSLTQLNQSSMAPILGYWITCGVKMMSLRHGWGWQPTQTIYCIHMRHIQSVWAHWYAVHRHLVAALSIQGWD